MLAYLLDEHLSPEIAVQIRHKRPGIVIESVQTWRAGQFRQTEDTHILMAAAEARLTLVTYDRSTILPVLEEWGQAGRSHAGVLFISHRAIPSSAIGALVNALIVHWEATQADDWTDRIEFLRPVASGDVDG